MFRELHRVRVLLAGAVLVSAGVVAVAAHAATPGLPPQFAEWIQLRSQPQVVLASDIVDGFTWSVITYANVPSGQTCDGLKEPLPAGTMRQQPAPTYEISGACIPSANVFWAGPIRQDHGWLNAGPAAGEYVWGNVSPRISSLSVQLANCTTVRATLAHGVFLYVADDKSLAAGATPVRLIGKSSDGATVGSVALAQLPASVAQMSNLQGTAAAASATTPSAC
jgi:hypothetical protein